MSLNINDLKAHEQKLSEIIEHAKKERDAIRLLINGMRLRSDSMGTHTVQYKGVAETKVMGVTAFVRDFIDNHPDEGFTGRDVTNAIISSGIKKPNKVENLRATVSNYLKKYYDDGILGRTNIGSSESPKYLYEKTVTEQMELR